MTGLSDKQIEFLQNCDHRWNIKYGATRSGKTYLDYIVIPQRIIKCKGKPGLNVIIGNTKATLQRNIIEPLQDMYGANKITNISSDNTAYIYGEKVHCIGADKINQVDRIRGSSIKYCYGDEVATWNEAVFNILKSRLDKEYSHFDGTCNPEHPNHWLKRFIDNSEIDVFAQQYTLYDNPFLPEEFVRNLEIEYGDSVYYQRYILGNWVRAEGTIFPHLSNPDRWLVDEVPVRFDWIEVGFDIGGNGSAYALTATGYNDGVFYVLKSEKKQAEELNMEDIERFVVGFCDQLPRAEIINTDHVAVVVNSINDNTKYRADLTYKPPLEDRPFAITKLLSTERLKFIRGKCDDLIDEMRNLVYDDKSERAIPLDDGSMQIDTWDSFIYSISGRWHYIS